MSKKLKVGIFFGGPSREREISFKGGKTAYMHLDKRLFEPVLIFVDSLGNFIEVDDSVFEYESIRDFYPSKNLNKGFRVYIESLGDLNENQQYKLIYKIGKEIKPEKLSEKIDVALPVMHGPYAEDGSIQGLFEWFRVPYAGSNTLGSAVGINKPFQNLLLSKSNGQNKKSRIISKKEWDSTDRSDIFTSLTRSLGFPLVIKAPHQGSSIGVGIVRKRSMEEFTRRMSQCFFEQIIQKKEWVKLTQRQKRNFLEKIINLGEGIGFPVVLDQQVINHPADLLKALDLYFKTKEDALLSSVNAEDYVLIEEFIEGQEFSMGLIQDDNFNTYALPGTEIYGEIESFDFKSKYQSNVTKKRIPIDTNSDNLKKLEREGIAAFEDLGQNVICRIDGFITASNEIIFHDPNTLPGMSPSSLIFKQMAEVGLNISQAITYLIRQSLNQRIKEGKQTNAIRGLKKRLDDLISLVNVSPKKKIAVIFGENEEEYLAAQVKYNILSASEDFDPQCICAARNGNFYLIPINLMFKSGILEFGKSIGAGIHPFVKTLIDKTSGIREFYAGAINFEVKKISEDEINNGFESILHIKNDNIG
jgi:D-alanine-D-alanine ligase